MKEAGVDFITLCIDQNGALTLEQELKRQGMADVPVLLPQGYADAEFAEANAELLEGDVLSLFVRPFEANQEGTLVPEMIEWIERRRLQDERPGDPRVGQRGHGRHRLSSPLVPTSTANV